VSISGEMRIMNEEEGGWDGLGVWGGGEGARVGRQQMHPQRAKICEFHFS
jgi:hypothetical protein